MVHFEEQKIDDKRRAMLDSSEEQEHWVEPLLGVNAFATGAKERAQDKSSTPKEGKNAEAVELEEQLFALNWKRWLLNWLLNWKSKSKVFCEEAPLPSDYPEPALRHSSPPNKGVPPPCLPYLTRLPLMNEPAPQEAEASS